jgi:hypothetical protein
MVNIKTITKLRNLRKKAIVPFVIGILVIALPVFFILSNNKTEVQASWYSEEWRFRKLFATDPEDVSGTSDLINFPLLISTTDTDLAGKAQTDGDDIVFTDSTGTKLDHEIDRYNSTTGELTAWVRVPILYTAKETIIYMYYGNASAVNQQNPEGVWDSNYKMVQHFEETSGTHYDSTANNNDSTAISVTTQGSAAGKISGANTYSGSTQYVRIADSPSFDIGTGNMTLSIWFYADQLELNGLWTHSNNSTATDGWWVTLLGDARLNASLNDTDYTSGYSRWGAGAWTHLNVVKQGTSLLYYFNGVLTDTIAGGQNINNSAGVMTIGAELAAYTDSYFDGRLDEARFSNTNRNADWIATEYANQNNPAAFFSSTGVEEKNNQGPVLHIPFDEGHGTIAHDTIRTQNNGVISGGAAWDRDGMCITGSCLFFDGSDNEVTITNNDYISRFLVNGATFSTWIKPMSDGESNSGEIFSKGAGIYFQTINEGADGKVDLEAYIDLSSSNASVIAVDALTINRWHHVALTYANDADDEIEIYVDNVLVATSTNGSGSLVMGTSALSIGGYGAYSFHGVIDEFKIYDYAKTADSLKSDAMLGGGKSGSSVVFGETPTNLNLSNGLVAYWNMDEYSNGAGNVNRYDVSGNDNLLIDYNGTPSTTGVFGRAARFVQTSNNVMYIADTSQRGLESFNEFTMSMWVNPGDQTDWGPFIGKDYENGQDSFSFGRFHDNRLTFNFSENGFYYGDGDVWTDIGVLTEDVWQMLTVTYDGEYIRLFINGEELISGEFPYYYPDMTIFNSDSEFTIGAIVSNWSVFYLGADMDEVRIYNRGFSHEEVKQLYNFKPGPIMYYSFDEMEGEVAYDSGALGINVDFPGGTENPKWVRGIFGGAIESDGVDDYIVTANSISWDVYTTDNVTVEAWIKFSGPTGSSGGYIFGDGGGPLLFLDRATDSTYQICWYTSTPACSDVQTYQYNQWYHIAAVKQGTTNVSFYRDGISAGVDSSLSETTENETYLEMLSGTSGWKFKGALDEMRVYDYIRTPSQIISDMNAGHPTPGSPIGSSVAQWNFDEGIGDTAYNKGYGGSSTNGNLGGTGVVCPSSGTNACPTWTPSGKFNGALSFDGGDYVDSSTEAPFDNDDWTISAWVNRTAVNASDSIVSKRGADGSGGYSIAVGGSGEVYCQTDNGSTVDSSYTATGIIPASSGWVHVTGVKSGTSCSVYINGEDATVTRATHTTLATNNTNIRVGGNTHGADFWEGLIDEVAIYSTALSSEQVKLLYNYSKSLVVGSLSTDSSGNPDYSMARSYCPPGNTETNCDTGQNPAPVGFWKIDENTGLTVYDYSGNNNTGTLTNGPTRTLGVNGSGAVNTNLADAHVAVPDPTNGTLDFGAAADFTYEAWIKAPTSNTSRVIVNKNYDGTGGGYRMRLTTSGIAACDISDTTQNGELLSGSTRIDDNEWHHIACVVHGSAVTPTFYVVVDGRVEGSQVIDYNGSRTNTANFTISANSSSSYFRGDIDHVLVYNYRRTTAQIQWDFNQGKPFHWYKFDECQNSTVYDSGYSKENGTIAVGDASGDNDSVGTCASGSSTEMWGEGATGIVGSALAFDGTNDVVTLGDMSILEGSSQATWAFWVKPTNLTTSDCIVCKLDISPSTVNAWAITTGSTTASYLSVAIATSATDTTTGAYVPSGPLQNETWIHVTVVFDGTQSTNETRLRIFVNGKQETLGYGGTIPATLLANTIPVTVGAGNDAGIINFAGLIDDLRIYNYPISSEQIRDIYNSGSAVRFD